MTEPVQQRQTRRRPALAAAIKQAVKAGLEVVGATLAPDGSVSLEFCKRGDDGRSGKNPWDEVLIDAADKKRLT